MERHCQNAQAVAEWLEARDEVEWVNYPGLASSPWHERASSGTCPAANGAILAFGIKGGLEAGQAVHRGPRAVQPPRQRRRRAQPRHPPGVDDPLASSPPSEQTTTGVTPDLVRLCIGIETLDDILADLEAGFRAAKGA